MEAYQRYGYGKINKNKGCKLVFNDNRNSKGNQRKQQNKTKKKNNLSGDARNRQCDDGYYAQHHYKNTNRNGKYYVKKSTQSTSYKPSVQRETVSNNETVSPARSDTSNPMTTDTDLEKK